LDVKEKFKTAPPISFQIFAHIVEEKATPITEVRIMLFFEGPTEVM